MPDGRTISLGEVSYHFGSGRLRKKILHEISADIDAGEIVILTGPSGSGKTTLLSLIGALRSGQAGSMQVLGHELCNSSERQRVKIRRQIGYIFQQHNLLDCLSIQKNVRMALQLQGVFGSESNRRAAEVLDRVGLAEHAHKKPAELSGGQKQRAGIARALVNRPRVVLADEPTSSLDRQSGRDVVELIQGLAREDGAAVVLVTHDNRILDVADRILHLEDGRLKTLTEAVAEDTSRMFQLLEKYDPGSIDYLATLAFSLSRIAFADRKVTDQEREKMRQILREVGDLEPAEIDFIMEISLMQRHVEDTDRSPVLSRAGFDRERSRHFIDSLYAIANSDGQITGEEVAEIKTIAAEFGLEAFIPPPGS
jgi:putative ABC transport system ATP-binding protein